jgi:hypothetical protein
VGQAERDRQNRTGRSGQAEQEMQNRKGRTGETEQERQNRRGMSGQAGQERQNWTGRTGQGIQARQNKNRNGRTRNHNQESHFCIVATNHVFLFARLTSFKYHMYLRFRENCPLTMGRFLKL